MHDRTNSPHDLDPSRPQPTETVLTSSQIDPQERRSAAIEELPQLRLHHRGRNPSDSEQQFIDSCALKFDLDPSRWGAFLTAWGRSVEAFNTPLSFLDSLCTSKLTFTVEGKAFQGHSVTFSDRNALVSQYNREFRIIPNRDDYGPRMQLTPASCVLCECVAQAEDHKNAGGLGDSVTLMEYESFSLMANRFPWEPGNLLLMPFSHDQLSRSSYSEDMGGKTRIHEPGMSWGVPSAHYFETMFRVSDLFDFVSIRNHPENGMSQPHHDHAHCFPSDLPKGFIPRALAETLRGSGKISNSLYIEKSPLSPFSVLVLASEDRATLAERASSLMCDLERQGCVPVCSYYGGVLTIGVLSPKEFRPQETPRIGARMLLNYFTASELEDFTQTCRYFPGTDEFDWNRFL